MRALVLVAALFLAGCGLNPEPLSNQQIIDSVKLCRDAGLKPALLVNGMTGCALAVECRS